MTDKKIEELLKEKKIYQIINSKVVETVPTVSVDKAIQIMQENHSGYVLLTEDKVVKGVFTETDVVMKILGKNIDLNKPVSEFMTVDPFALSPQDSVGEAIDLMAKKSIYHLPLVDSERRLTGMLSVRALIRCLSEFYPTEVYNLPPDPSQFSSEQEGG